MTMKCNILFSAEENTLKQNKFQKSRYRSAQVTPQLMQQFGFIEMIWCHRRSLTLSSSVDEANGQK